MGILNQVFRIPGPTLTERNLPSQAGKVFIVTGGYAGVGEQLCSILYGAGGTVYVAGRSSDKATSAIGRIQSQNPESNGKVAFLEIDLADLATIKPAVEEFLGKESRLDVLTNNAGVMFGPTGARTVQGLELQMGTNCVGHFLFTQLLRPVLAATAKEAPAGSVRVTWAASLAMDLLSPKPGALRFEPSEEGRPVSLGKQGDYGQSKAGNLLLSCEAKKRWGNADGVVHLAHNPGNLKTELPRHALPGAYALLSFILHPPIMGAYTELYAGWSEQLGVDDSGSYIIPWGRKGTYRADIAESLKTKAEGGSGKAEAFWNWCEKETSAFK